MRHQIQEDNGDHRSVQIFGHGQIWQNAKAGMPGIPTAGGASGASKAWTAPASAPEPNSSQGFPLIPSVSESFARRTPV